MLSSVQDIWLEQNPASEASYACQAEWLASQGICLFIIIVLFAVLAMWEVHVCQMAAAMVRR